jgi:hypothetical protein
VVLSLLVTVALSLPGPQGAPGSAESLARSTFQRWFGMPAGELVESRSQGSGYLLRFTSGRFVFDSKGVIVEFDRFSDEPSEFPTAGVLSEEQAIERAKFYYRDLGYSGELMQFIPMKRMAYSGLGPVLELQFLQGKDGILSDFHSLACVMIHPTSGELRFIQIGKPNPLPEQMHPRIAPEEARARMLAEIMPRADSVVLVEDSYRPLRLMAWIPKLFLKQFPHVPEAEAFAEQGRSLLVYHMALTSLDRKELWWGFVDARNGRVAGLYKAESGLGSRMSVEQSEFALDLDSGPITVTLGTMSSTALGASVEQVPKPKKVGTCIPVVLTRGKLNIKADFDRGTGLLYVGSRERPSVGKPSANLLAAILTLIQKKSS